MMECISSVQYQVLLNGQPRGLIIPQRGLRQGDSLSPYLFILCTEALIANIKKVERDKQLTEIKVARACPSISHLLFADDSLFFCKAQKEECHTILRILKEYKKASGQLINFDKSSTQFGHKNRRICPTRAKRYFGHTESGRNGNLYRIAGKSWGF